MFNRIDDVIGWMNRMESAWAFLANAAWAAFWLTVAFTVTTAIEASVGERVPHLPWAFW